MTKLYDANQLILISRLDKVLGVTTKIETSIRREVFIFANDMSEANQFKQGSNPLILSSTPAQNRGDVKVASRYRQPSGELPALLNSGEPSYDAPQDSTTPPKNRCTPALVSNNNAPLTSIP